MNNLRWKMLCCLLLLQGFALGARAQQRLVISGQYRPRTELRHGYRFVREPGDAPAFLTEHRARLAALLELDKLRFNVSLQDIRVWGEVPSTTPRSDDRLSAHEIWADVTLADSLCGGGGRLGAKIGRQEIAYDGDRILGTLEWAAQARRHDAVVLQFTKGDFLAHGGVSFNQAELRLEGTAYPTDHYKTMQYVYLRKGVPGSKSRAARFLSLLALKDDYQRFSVDSLGERQYGGGVRSRYTFGAMLEHDVPGTRLFGQLYGYAQRGKEQSGQNLSAEVVGGYLGSSLSLGKWDKRLEGRLGLDWLTGDDPATAASELARPNFGTNHKFYGFMDYWYVATPYEQPGLIDVYQKLRLYHAWPYFDTWEAKLHAHEFFANAAVALPGGTEMRPYLGTETDFVLTWRPKKYIQLDGAYCFMVADDAMFAVKGPGTRTWNHFAYLMLKLTPSFVFDAPKAVDVRILEG